MDKELESGFAKSLSVDNAAMIVHLPYLLQDFDSFSLTRKDIAKLLRKKSIDSSDKVLDLACGKGVASVYLAKKFGCMTTGIDLMPAFIEYANELAKSESVSDLCVFYTGDVNAELKRLNDYDIVIITDFSDVITADEPIEAIKSIVKTHGFLIIDDAFEDELAKNEFETKLKQAGFLPEVEIIFRGPRLRRRNKKYYRRIKKRIYELIKKYPEERQMFERYLQNQQDENEQLENELICTTMLCRRL